MKTMTLFLLTFGLFVSIQASPKRQPVIIKFGLNPEQATYKKVAESKKAAEYLLIESKKDAEKYFSEKEMKSIATIDFSKRKLVIFVWSGSGKDKIEPNVAESYPEQISFNKIRGRTRDLRRHFVVFSIRKNAILK